ncbi:hypothetical protein O181_104918 [Austropuccinia psidii MF-1]|uniref:Reverse transcriptase Ty1/copia-type domain-containing protein n=1 Tax=Austropuccinia psidii MF-1 TaxID=1389203 RepID=A0A9Q3PKH2_9BASI|nr:hypothetical protein [Austropuccinia psidii MF-1]
MVVVTRNVTFNEEVFPTVANGKTSSIWNVEGDRLGEGHLDLPIEPIKNSSIENPQILYDEHPDHLEEPALEPETDPTSTLNDPVPVDHLEQTDQQQPENNIRLRIIGPRHPTLINSNMDPSHILPYSRRARAFVTTSDIPPRTYRLALQCEDRTRWMTAIESELAAMNKLKVWDIVKLKRNYKLVGTTWVFKVKKDHLHHTVEHKARLCAQGFTQTPGIDFEKTYAPTGRLNSLRSLTAHSCCDDLDFHQIDYCLRLNKAIYGLKQAALAWYNHLKNWLQSAGFNACKLDPCVFYWKQPDALWIYVHVDEMAIFGKNIQPFKEQIDKEFSIKDIGPADLLLGVKIQQMEDCVTLDQQHFVDSLLELYGMQHCKTVRTPLVPNEYLSPATDNERKTFEEMGINFRSALEKPGTRHWKAFLHVLKYLRGTQELGLHYWRRCDPGVIAFSNADWGNCQVTRRSTSGYLGKLHGCLLFWKTRKQPTVSISTAEAEYKSLCDLTSELLCFRQWCQEADIFNFNSAITVWEDNQSCIKTANGNCNVNTKRMKHVDIQLHFVKEAIQNLSG